MASENDDDAVVSPAVATNEASTLSDTTRYRVNVASRERTPDMAVQTFDGDFVYANGRQVQTRCCTRPLFNFVVTAVLICGAFVTCMIMLSINGFTGPASEWLKTIAAFCMGVFVPNPQIEKNKNNGPPRS
jgi:hypothetical protein